MARKSGMSKNGTWAGMNWCRKDLRLAIYLRDGMACMWCGSTLEDGAQLALDHIVPDAASATVDNKPANLICCCAKCNSVRSDRSAEEFATATAGYLNKGISPEQILAGIEQHAGLDIKPFRDEAKAILARRPSWQEALSSAKK